VQQIEERSGFPWRAVSALMILCLSAVLALFFLTDAFYVRGVSVSGVRYMTREEVFTYADIARMHIFWVEPETVRDNVRRYPTVADAEVYLSWPPNMVHIVVEERAPALIWEQNETAVWVDIQGNTMALREDRDDLIRIIAPDPLADGPLGDSGELSTDVVYGALQLQELRPDIPEWRYDVSRGLGFQNENGWTVWFGTGTSMPQKLQIYDALKARLLAEGRTIREINLSNPDAPVYMSLE
jgi:cell division septal protein FtsQ